MCGFSSHSFWTSSSLDVPAGVTQEEGHTGFLIHLRVCIVEKKAGMYGYTYSKSMDQPSKVANPASGKLNREN